MQRVLRLFFLIKQPVAACLLIILFSLSACKKSTTQPNNEFTGKWRWLVSVNGFGQTSTPASTGNNQTLALNADSTYVFYLNNSFTDNGMFHIAKKTNPLGSGTDDIITFQPAKPLGTGYSDIISLSNDTLTISTTFSWEGSSSKYVRSNN